MKTISIVGLGYVGLLLAVVYSKKYKVIGFVKEVGLYLHTFRNNMIFCISFRSMLMSTSNSFNCKCLGDIYIK